jgi:hypothetical protein
MIIFTPQVAYWVGFTAVCILLLIFAARVALPWAKRHAVVSFFTRPLEKKSSKPVRRVMTYVHGENQRGAKEPAKAKRDHHKTAVIA